MVEDLLQEVRAKAVDVRAEFLERLERGLERAPDPAPVTQDQHDQRGSRPPAGKDAYPGGLTQQGVHGLQEPDHASGRAAVQIVDDEHERAPGPARTPHRPDDNGHAESHERHNRPGEGMLQGRAPHAGGCLDGQGGVPGGGSQDQPGHDT